MTSRTSTTALFTGLLLLAAPAAAEEPVVALKVGKVLVGNGESLPGAWLILRGDRIESVSAEAPPPGAWRMEFPEATACPGFVDPVTALGAGGNLAEPTRAMTPEIDAADALHARHSEFRDAARGGITTVGLSPSSSNVVGGRVAVARTSGPEEQARLIGNGPLRLALVSTALQADREPTSRMGALALLRAFFAESPEAARGPVLIEAHSADEIRLALATLGERPVTVLQPADVEDALPLLTAAGASAIVGPFGTASATRDVRRAVWLSEAGVPVAFTGAGDPAALRITAALAVREGMSPAAALEAVTLVPARILGSADRAGTLEVGKQADVLIFSGHPLDLGAKLQAVLLGGLPLDLDDDQGAG